MAMRMFPLSYVTTIPEGRAVRACWECGFHMVAGTKVVVTYFHGCEGEITDSCETHEPCLQDSLKDTIRTEAEVSEHYRAREEREARWEREERAEVQKLAQARQKVRQSLEKAHRNAQRGPWISAINAVFAKVGAS